MKGHYILDSFVPAGLSLCKRIVVQIFVFGDFGFKRDVLANVKVAAIQKQRREQSTHSSVSVIEGVDAQKVMDKTKIVINGSSSIFPITRLYSSQILSSASGVS